MKSNIEFLYEELRKATDGGSESMTHDDALKQIAYWQDKCSQVQAVEPTSTKTEQIAGAISKHISTPLFQREVMAAAQYIVHRYLHPAPPPAMHLSEILAEKGIKLRTEFEPKPDHIVDSNKMVGERAELIQWVREFADMEFSQHSTESKKLRKAADMLEADASRITELEALSVTNILLDVVPGDGSGLEIFAKSTSDVVDLLSKMSEKIEDFESSKQAQQVAVPARECPYIGDPSRVCNKCGQRHGKPTFPQQVAVPVPMTTAEKSAAWGAATIEMPSHENCYLRGMLDAEAHHGITQGDRP